MRLITQDLAQLHPRATREELGESYQPSLLADPSAQFALEFSRGGWANPAGLPRGTVLRVAYDWEDDKLVRWHWAVMDRTLVDAAGARRDLWTASRTSRFGFSIPRANGTSSGRRSTSAGRRA